MGNNFFPPKEPILDGLNKYSAIIFLEFCFALIRGYHFKTITHLLFFGEGSRKSFGPGAIVNENLRILP